MSASSTATRYILLPRHSIASLAMQCQVGCIALSGAPVTLTYSRRTTNIPVTIVFFTDESFPLHGVIKRTQVLRMLKHRIGLFTHDGMSALPPAKARIPKSQVRITTRLPWASSGLPP